MNPVLLWVIIHPSENPHTAHNFSTHCIVNSIPQNPPLSQSSSKIIMPSDVTTVAVNDAPAAPKSPVSTQAPPLSPVSTGTKKRMPSTYVVTPTKLGSPIKVEPSTPKKSKLNLPPIDSIVFHDRAQATSCLQAIRGPNCSVPDKLTDIISAILSLYPVSDLKPFWQGQFPGGELWKNKPTAVQVLMLKIATNDKHTSIAAGTTATNITTFNTQNVSSEDTDANKK